MDVTLDLTPAVHQHAGLGRYASELARALIRLRSDLELRGLSVGPKAGALAPPLERVPLTVVTQSDRRWKLDVLRSSLTRSPMDKLIGPTSIFHATANLLPYLEQVRTVFTLHDLIFKRYPETLMPLNRWYQRLMMPVFLRRADAVICVSEQTKADAKQFYGVDERKLHVIPEGVDSRFGQELLPDQLAAVRARYRLPDCFLLYVGTIEPRKNLSALWEAYRTLRNEGRTEGLVVVGRRGWLHQPVLEQMRALGLEDDVIMPGFVEEADLPALYALATCFVFPSVYEGFGLPPLEAMAAGCPVVCSNSSSLPEVCGDAALLVPPTDVQELLSALRRVLDEPELRERLRERGLHRAAAFTWDATALRTLEVYEQIMADTQSA